MKMIKMVLLAGISGTLATASTFATPLDITFNLGAPQHYWGDGQAGDFGFQYEDIASISSQSPASGVLNLAGVNSIQVTWNAPAGYMFVVTPPPAAIGTLILELETSYGYDSSAANSLVASLGHITSQNMSAHLIYGSSPFFEGLTAGGPLPVALNALAKASITPNTQPFAFNSITISANFSGTGASGTLDESGNWDGFADFGAVLYGIINPLQYGMMYNGPPDPGQLLTLEPLPTNGSVPDTASTLGLAGLSFVGLWLLGCKRDGDVA